jgi:hypothetical protein
MEQALRRHAAAGVALVCAGLIAATLVVAPQQTFMHARFIHARGAALTAGSGGLDLITPWEQGFSTTTDNAQTVFDAAQVALSTLFGGLSAEFHELSANPATFFDNLQTALEAVALIGAPDNVASAVVEHTLGGVTEASGGGLLNGGLPVAVDNAHVQVYEGLLGQGFTVPSGAEGELVSALANFAASPLSGVLIGAVGPFISPEVELFNSLQADLADLTGSDPTAVLTNLINTPADVVNAFFNGATLNLDVLAPLLQNTLFADNENGTGEVINGLSLAFGGLFSPGQVVDGAGGPMYDGVGGSILNSIGFDLSFFPPDNDAGATLDVPALGVGPIAAMAELLDIIGQALAGSLVG